MPAPKNPNTAAATAAVRRRGDETAAARLRAHGWFAVPPWIANELRAEIAEMIADWWGRSATEADCDLAQQIIDRIQCDDDSTRHRDPTYGWQTDSRA
jgi:hypothetical protein